MLGVFVLIMWLQKKSISKAELLIILILLGIAFSVRGATTALKIGLHYKALHGESMEKTLSDGTKVLFINANFKGINRGDIVSVSAYEEEKLIGLVKRVIAIPNETIRIQKNKIFINGELLEEPYAYYSGPSEDDIAITLPEDTYFVMGDNRLDSLDSRVLGPIPRDLIRKVVLKSKK
jgi:signal peptidase I